MRTSTLLRLGSFLFVLSLAATACDLEPDDPSSQAVPDPDPGAEADPAGARYLPPNQVAFTCDKTPADVTSAWPGGIVQLPLVLPTQSNAVNLCGKPVAQVTGLTSGNFQIDVTGPQAAEGNGWPQSDVLEYTIYGLSRNFCTTCSSQWSVLASGTSVGIARINNYNPNVVYIAYPVAFATASSAAYMAIRVAATYHDRWGGEYPVKVAVTRLP